RASLTAVAPYSGGSNRARPGWGVWTDPSLDGLHGRGRPGDGPNHGDLRLAAPRSLEIHAPAPTEAGYLAPSSATPAIRRGGHGGIVDCRAIRRGGALVRAPSNCQDAILAVLRESITP